MKRKNIILAILILLANLSVFGQDVNKVELLSSKDNSTTISFTLTDYQFEIVTTQQGNAYTISAENTVSMLEKDAPDLPKFTTSIIIPDGDEMKITVVSSKYTDYDEEIIIAPSKGKPTADGEIFSISTKAATYGVCFPKLGHVKSGIGTHGLVLAYEYVEDQILWKR